MNTSQAPGVGPLVAARLASAGISVKAASEATGIPRATLIRRLSGHSPFDTTQLERIATLIGTKPSELMAEAERGAA